MSAATQRNLRRTYQNLRRGLQVTPTQANYQRNLNQLLRGLQGTSTAANEQRMRNLGPRPRRQAPVERYIPPHMINETSRDIPSGSSNTISLDNIANGNSMINFHNEYQHERYYKNTNLSRFTKNRNGYPLNPITRQRITNATRYKASVPAGGRQKRKTRRRQN